MLKKKKHILGSESGESGQALFELIVFLPLLLLILTLMVTIGNAINASINQQKVTRGYFYYNLRGNSLGLNSLDISQYEGDFNMTSVGMNVIGWRRRDTSHSETDTYATCFKFNSLFTGDVADQDCDNPVVNNATTPIVRIFTAYGICTETYTRLALPQLSVNHMERSRASRCGMQQ